MSDYKFQTALPSAEITEIEVIPAGRVVAQISIDNQLASTKPRSRTWAALCSGALEGAFLALLSWLGSIVITGLVHCALAHYCGDPDLLASLHDGVAATGAPTHRAGPHEDSR